MIKYYILKNKKVIPCDWMTWAVWFEKADWQVAKDTFGNACVSTVFLGLNHSLGDGPPMLFETMVFGGTLDQEQTQCSTWDEAKQMHLAMVKRVETGKVVKNLSKN